MKTMKQIQLTDVRKFEVQEVPIPEPGPNEVLIKVEAVGICGSDMHSYTGHHPFVHPPIVLGHEYSGIVEAVGENVHRFQKGQRVTSEIAVTCGQCYNCKRGRYQLCERGKYLGNVGIDGAMAEFLVIDAERVHAVPDNMTPEQVSMVEPLAVSFHAVRLSNFKVGDTAMVIGAGVIGNLTAQVLKMAGVRTLVVTDVVDARLELIKKQGADVVLNPIKTDPAEWVRENMGPEKMDLIFDCVGNEATLDQAINTARKGTEIILVGVPPVRVPVNMAFVQDRELIVVGSLQYVAEDYVRAIHAISHGRVDVDSLITDVFSINDYEQAYAAALDKDRMTRGGMKVLMKY